MKTNTSHNYRIRGLSVDGIIIKADTILLIQRKYDPYAGYWAIPGGYVDFDETVEEAVAREVHEETGLIVTSSSFLGIYSNPKRHPKQIVAVTFVTETTGIPHAGDDAMAFSYFPLSSLPKNLAFDHIDMIADYQKRFSSVNRAL